MTAKDTPMSLHAERFPGESAEYRKARNELLQAEIELRRRVEEVAALRRRLPPGGPVAQDYEFEEGAADLDDTQTVRRVKFSELFTRANGSLAVYSFMYGPQMAKACPMCTSMLDSLNGTAPHAGQRINLVVVAKSPIARIRAFARERGWRNLRLLSSANNSYNHDYHGEDDKGSQLPTLNVFTRRGGEIRHSTSTELLFVPAESGQNGRHVDLIWPLWNLFDFTPEGRGTDWYPSLSYDS
jgi:predicted dithiol-disulfide oxidoreductase (DUF899 family)